MKREAEVVSLRLHPDAEPPRGVGRWSRSLTEGLRVLYRAHRERPFDAVVSSFHAPPRILPSVPMLGYVHDLRPWGVGEAAYRGITPHLWRAVFRTWDAALVPSSHVERDVRRLVPGLSVVCVPEGLDHLRPAAPPTSARSALLVLGGRAPHKRAELGLAAAERLCEELECTCIVVGEPTSPPRSKRVEVHRAPTDEELAKLLGLAAVAVAPTSYEGFGLAVGEAMAAGVPVVYGRDSMLQGLVQGGGVPVEPTVAALADGVRRVLSDRDKYAAEARRLAAAYTWRGTALGVLEVVATIHTRCRRGRRGYVSG